MASTLESVFFITLLVSKTVKVLYLSRKIAQNPLTFMHLRCQKNARASSRKTFIIQK